MINRINNLSRGFEKADRKANEHNNRQQAKVFINKEEQAEYETCYAEYLNDQRQNR